MSMSRRDLLEHATKFIVLSGAAAAALDASKGIASAGPARYEASEHWWGMTIDIEKCVGCGNCVRACSRENKVADGYFRTWVERYHVTTGEREHPQVESPRGGIAGFPPSAKEDERSFYVPKLCNHCVDSPCVQVCPVGATFDAPDGVVLVDQSYCIGCRYCVQACPYGCRYIDPARHTVEKCNLCYHRITKGLTTACCESCPTGARKLADLKDPKDPAHAFLRDNAVQVLKPHMATGSKVYYKDLDGSVR